MGEENEGVKDTSGTPASIVRNIREEYIGERGNFGVTTLMESVIYNPVKYNEIPFLLGKEFAL